MALQRHSLLGSPTGLAGQDLLAARTLAAAHSLEAWRAGELQHQLSVAQAVPLPTTLEPFAPAARR